MIGSLPVTNSMITSWIISLAIIFIIRILVGKATLVPSKGQLFVESIVGGMRGIVEPIVGNRAFFASFWLLSGLFIFILINNWRVCFQELVLLEMDTMMRMGISLWSIHS